MPLDKKFHVGGLSQSRLDLPTIQTDFKTNRLTIDLSEAELRQKMEETINQFNSLGESVANILEAIQREIDTIINARLDEMIENGQLAEIVNNEIVKTKQDKTDQKLVTTDKTVVGAINETLGVAKGKSIITVEDDGIGTFMKNIKLKVLKDIEDINIVQVSPNLGLREV